MKYNTATPYAACYVIFRKGNQVAFVKREHTGWMDDYYGLAAGKAEKGETFLEGAIREAKEEVGIDLKPADLKMVLMAHRHAEDDWVDVIFEATQWEGELYNAEPHMHSELVWLDTDNLPENVIPAVRFYLEQIKAGATYAEYGW